MNRAPSIYRKVRESGSTRIEEKIQTEEAAVARSATVTRESTPAIDSGVSFIGGLLRLSRFRAHEATAEKDPGDTVSPRGRPDRASDVARSPMEAGLTRGASLLFGGRE